LNAQPLFPPLPQFKHIKRYWDQARDIPVALINPGEVYVTKQHELISTLLGSCIAVCMRDKVSKTGGMNHFKLPAVSIYKNASIDTNYGQYAMELLINEIMKNGGKKPNLECKVYGGGNVIASMTNPIGTKNIQFAMEYLRAERIPIRHQETGFDCAQQVYFHPQSGKAFSVAKSKVSPEELKKAEEQYLKNVNTDAENQGAIYFD